MTDGLVGGENEIAEYEKVGMTEKVSKIKGFLIYSMTMLDTEPYHPLPFKQ